MLEKVVHESDHFWDHLTEQTSVNWSIKDLPDAAHGISLHFDSGFLCQLAIFSPTDFLDTYTPSLFPSFDRGFLCQMLQKVVHESDHFGII